MIHLVARGLSIQAISCQPLATRDTDPLPPQGNVEPPLTYTFPKYSTGHMHACVQQSPVGDTATKQHRVAATLHCRCALLPPAVTPAACVAAIAAHTLRLLLLLLLLLLQVR
jgi:hypothetical protein